MQGSLAFSNNNSASEVEDVKK